jgi:hypothetical protein
MRERCRVESFICLCICSAGATGLYAQENAKTLQEIINEVTQGHVGKEAKAQPSQPPVLTPEGCPDPTTLDLFKYEITFERTEEAPTLKGLSVIHADVWERGSITAFDIREPLRDFATPTRMSYLFDEDGMNGGGSCPAEQNWAECVEKFTYGDGAGSMVRTCVVTIDIRAIPAWKPSPDSPEKRRVAGELRSEIEAKWRGVQQIVIRDFDLRDPQITMYLKMPDGDYFQGCGFHAGREPHCTGWHLFGQAPLSSIRRWIFEKPYRLK